MGEATLLQIVDMVVSPSDVVVNCIARLGTLKAQPTEMIEQLHMVKIALNQLSTMKSSNINQDIRYQQLAVQIGNAFDSFRPIVLALSQQLERSETTETATTQDKPGFMNSERVLTTLSILLGRQLNALNLILQAIQCQNSAQQSELMREQKNQSVLRLAQDCSSSLAGINDISEFISENPSAMSARFESGEVLRDHTGDRQEFRPVSPTVTLSQGNATGSDSLYDPTEAEDFSRYSSSSEDFRYSSETLTAGGADRAYAPVGGRFPAKLSLYYPAGHFFLATRITEPLYGVQVNYRSYIPADAEITLRAGPHGDAPRLASLRLTGNSVSIWAANQSSLDLSQVAVSINAPGGRFGIGYGTLSFAVPVPVPDGDGRPAEFEWKHSLVPEVFSAHSAWKLKRRPALSEGETQSPEASSAGKSAEGETVATLSFKKDSRTKILTIRFEGSGATGDLGELWAAVTIMTSLAIYHHKPSTR